MKSFSRVGYILIFSLFSFFALGQEPMNCVGHIDKPIYVTGEVVWFDVLLPSFLHEKEFTVLTSVHRPDGRSVEQFFIKSEGRSHIEGYYKIPFSLEAGLYRIHMAVHSVETNANEDLMTMVVPIYNDLKSAPTNLSLIANSLHGDEVQGEGLQISIDTKSSVLPRSATAATVQVSNAQGDPVAAQLSVSVTDEVLLSNLAYSRTTFRGHDLDRFNLQQLENAVFIKGRVIHQDRDEPVKLNVFGGYSGTDNRIYYTGTDDDGRFLMKIPDYTGIKPIQLMGYQREEDRIRVNLDRTALPKLDEQLAYTEGTLEYMNWSRLRKKIFQYYGEVETPIDGQSVIPEPQVLKPDAKYIMAEYESFETVSSFFNELMAALTFNLEDDSSYQASMYNPSGRIAKNTYLSGDPLFIIDDKATRDADFVAAMSASPIETMELFLQPRELLKTFSALGISGVVRIKTKLRDIEVPREDSEEVFRISGLQPKASFPEKAKTGDGQVPRFGTSLHWISSLTSDANGQATLTYDQTDDLSTYKIKILAKDSDGQIGTAEQTYHSKK